MSAGGFVGAGDTPVPHANPHIPAGAMFPLFQSTAGVGVRLGAAGSAMVSCGVCLSVCLHNVSFLFPPRVPVTQGVTPESLAP